MASVDDWSLDALNYAKNILLPDVLMDRWMNWSKKHIGLPRNSHYNLQYFITANLNERQLFETTAEPKRIFPFVHTYHKRTIIYVQASIKTISTIVVLHQLVLV